MGSKPTVELGSEPLVPPVPLQGHVRPGDVACGETETILSTFLL